ncbi:MAG: galactose-1-epimerase, partial [Clostridiales bacterium]|nr:galactose-1-epimerase [Clostridiales bacterium]
MESSGGAYADITSYGCRVVDLAVPDKDGNMTDVLLGYKDLDGYFADTCFHGAIVGRSANRIAGATCVISSVKCDLPVNDGPHNLHSGTPSFQDQFWDGEIIDAAKADAIIAESKIE